MVKPFLAGALTTLAALIAVALLSGVAARRRRMAAWARLREDWDGVEAALR